MMAFDHRYPFHDTHQQASVAVEDLNLVHWILFWTWFLSIFLSIRVPSLHRGLVIFYQWTNFSQACLVCTWLAPDYFHLAVVITQMALPYHFMTGWNGVMWVVWVVSTCFWTPPPDVISGWISGWMPNKGRVIYEFLFIFFIALMVE